MRHYDLKKSINGPKINSTFLYKKPRGISLSNSSWLPLLALVINKAGKIWKQML